MPFKQSIRAAIEEVALEMHCVSVRYVEQIQSVVELLHQQERLDLANDMIRLRAKLMLCQASRDCAAQRWTYVPQQIFAALQIIDEQEQADLADDAPRLEALSQMVKLQTRMIEAQRQLRDLTGRLSRARLEEVI